MRGGLRRFCISSVGGHYQLPGPYSGKSSELKMHVENLLKDDAFLFGGLNLNVSLSDTYNYCFLFTFSLDV